MNLIERPLPGIAGILSATPEGICAQESRGTACAATSGALPTNADDRSFRVNPDDLTWKVLEAWGVKPQRDAAGNFVPNNGDDKLFVQCELPAGWTVKNGYDHSMTLLDEQERVRATMFYKAAFYDRSASISARRLYDATYAPAVGTWEKHDRKDGDVAVVKEGGNEIFRSGTVRHDTGSWKTNDMVYASDSCRRESQEWLDVNRPGWRGYFAWWDGVAPQIVQGEYANLANSLLGRGGETEIIWVSPPGRGAEPDAAATLIVSGAMAEIYVPEKGVVAIFRTSQ